MKSNTELKVEKRVVSEEIWETFDEIFRTVNKQNRRVEELEARVIELEKKMKDKAQTKAKTLTIVSKMTAEKAA